MQIIDTAIISVKDFYNKIEDTTKKRPVAIIISNLALAILSALISPISSILAIGVFSFSLFFTVAIVKNFEKVCQRIEEQITELFAGRAAAARVRGRRDGRDLAEGAERLVERARGIVEGVAEEILP
ncbi:MAG: hypothetical protein KR126chlam4_00842 [Candidatus Anoxychlamydiales bacterium]|nr:hypothetical protein [Candidatus Anoxychlamydiales bacterium]HEU64694.1 hypothetical protein [Chlamydiota bacterium]